MDSATHHNNLHIVSTAIYSSLAALDLNAAVAFRQLYCEPADQSLAGQISSANRFWRGQLSQIDCATVIHAKFCLNDGMDLHEWLRLFSHSVAPIVVQYELPSSHVGSSLADSFDIETICQRLSSQMSTPEVGHG